MWILHSGFFLVFAEDLILWAEEGKSSRGIEVFRLCRCGCGDEQYSHDEQRHRCGSKSGGFLTPVGSLDRSELSGDLRDRSHPRGCCCVHNVSVVIFSGASVLPSASCTNPL